MRFTLGTGLGLTMAMPLPLAAAAGIRRVLKLHCGKSDVDLDNSANVARVRKIFEAAKFRLRDPRLAP